jgi:hypothetical protein
MRVWPENATVPQGAAIAIAIAIAIARDLGLAGDGARVVTGAELGTLDDTARIEAVRGTTVYARVSPEDKLRIVEALQRDGHVVAMTVDGVNDAPALKQADIGVAMGIMGTDVTQDAGDIVLQDDNFATIVGAVREGRVIFDNIRKFIRNILSGNLAEVAVMVLGPLLGTPIPLLPLQILWLNLVNRWPAGHGDGRRATRTRRHAASAHTALREPARLRPREADPRALRGAHIHGEFPHICCSVPTTRLGRLCSSRRSRSPSS